LCSNLLEFTFCNLLQNDVILHELQDIYPFTTTHCYRYKIIINNVDGKQQVIV